MYLERYSVARRMFPPAPATNLADTPTRRLLSKRQATAATFMPSNPSDVNPQPLSSLCTQNSSAFGPVVTHQSVRSYLLDGP